jgi:histidyl-tRNA synthetase
MKDFEPGELAGIEEVRSRFLDLARIFDFSVMEPSPIESLSTLEAKGGPCALTLR